MNSKNTSALLIALIIGLGAGFLIEKRLVTGRSNREIARLESQIERAKKFFPPLLGDVRSVLGTVKALRGDTIVLETTVMNPFDESPHTRTVKILNETKIVHSERKDPAAYQREVNEFQKTVQAQPSTSPRVRLTPPNAFTQTPAKTSDIAVGQQISIAADENIRDKESFSAKTIVILPTGREIPLK